MYQQLLAEGCSPNLVTFNILIDIHGKSGQWAKAVEVLDQLQAQVGSPLSPLQPRTLACGGEASRQAHGAEERGMFRHPAGGCAACLPNPKPTASPATLAPSHHCDTCPLPTAPPQGCTPEPRTYNTIISACAKAGQPAAAAAVYERMLGDGVQPTSTSYTSLISAHGKAGQVEEALRIYQVGWVCMAAGARPASSSHPPPKTCSVASLQRH